MFGRVFNRGDWTTTAPPVRSSLNSRYRPCRPGSKAWFRGRLPRSTISASMDRIVNQIETPWKTSGPSPGRFWQISPGLHRSVRCRVGYHVSDIPESGLTQKIPLPSTCDWISLCTTLDLTAVSQATPSSSAASATSPTISLPRSRCCSR